MGYPPEQHNARGVHVPGTCLSPESVGRGLDPAGKPLTDTQDLPVGPPLFSDPGESFFGSFFAKKEQKPPTKKRGPQEAAQGVQNCLFSVDCTGRANALAGAAIDAGTSIDHSLVLHADRTDGAGVNTCTASNALAGNGMSHRELLISVLIDVPYRPCTAAPRYGATAGTGPAALQIVYHIV